MRVRVRSALTTPPHEDNAPLLEGGAVDLLLETRELHPHHRLLERRQRLDIALEAAQHVRPHLVRGRVGC